MKTAAIFVLLVLSVSLSSAQAAASAKPLRVLFVGNSYTYVNDLPAMIQAMAAADRRARPITIDRVLAGGAQLQWHWTGKGRGGKPVRSCARTVIEKGAFDVVIIQEQSQMPAVAPDVTVKYAALLCGAARARGAMPVMFMTWARRGDMADPRGGGRPAMSPKVMQAALAQAYTRAGKTGQADVAPVGLAWAAVRKAKPDLALHSRDGSHPGKAGTYLAACVFHAVLTGRSPVGLPAKLTAEGKGKTRTLAAIPPATAVMLQKSAWETVQAFRADYPKPKAPAKPTG